MFYEPDRQARKLTSAELYVIVEQRSLEVFDTAADIAFVRMPNDPAHAYMLTELEPDRFRPGRDWYMPAGTKPVE